MEQVKLLNKEITYVSTPDYLKPHKLYPTWEVSQAAYMKQLDKVQDTLDWEIISDSLVGITAFKTKSKPYLDLVDVLQEAVSKKDSRSKNEKADAEYKANQSAGYDERRN